MAINMVPLDLKKHKDIHVKIDNAYSHIQQHNMVPLVAFEFMKASTDYPIVFVKQQETGKFKSVALMGLEEGENLVFCEGQVKANYVPVNIRRYPFSAGGVNTNDDSMVLCIDENSALLNDKEGFRVFTDEGKISESTQQVSDLLMDLMARDQATDHFIECLIENELLQPTELTLKLGDDGERKIGGIYKVDEERLNNLSDDVVLQLYKRKYFAAIYSHLGSLSQFNRLLQLKAKFTAS